MEKQQVHPAITYQVTGELPPIEYNWLHILHVCKKGVEDGQLYIILPVEEPQEYKPMKRRLVKEDKSSPHGLIQRDEKATKTYYPHASARFDINEMATYAAKNFNNMPREELERMAQDVINGGV